MRLVDADKIIFREIDEIGGEYEPYLGCSKSQIDSLPSVTPQEPQTFKWCTDCKEYDQEKHCCQRWSKVIRNTVEEMKQEPKTGHWINGDDKCPCCGKSKFEDLYADIWADWQPKYCPNCGTKMVESQESEVEDGDDD